MLKATKSILSNPRFALTGRHSISSSAVTSNPRFALTGRHCVISSSRMTTSVMQQTSPISSYYNNNQNHHTNNNNNKWTDVQDELKDLQHLMTEYKTNKAVGRVVDPSVMGQMEELIVKVGTKSIDHDTAFEQAHHLKAVVKDALYYHPN